MKQRALQTSKKFPQIIGMVLPTQQSGITQLLIYKIKIFCQVNLKSTFNHNQSEGVQVLLILMSSNGNFTHDWILPYRQTKSLEPNPNEPRFKSVKVVSSFVNNLISHFDHVYLSWIPFKGKCDGSLLFHRFTEFIGWQKYPTRTKDCLSCLSKGKIARYSLFRNLNGCQQMLVQTCQIYLKY